MSIYDSLLSKEYKDVNKTTVKKGVEGEGDRNKTLRLHGKGRLTIPATIFTKAEGASFYSTLFNYKTEKLAIVFFKERPVEPHVRVVSFYISSRSKEGVPATAYIELKPALTKIFGKGFDLGSSIDIPYELKAGYLELDLKILK